MADATIMGGIPQGRGPRAPAVEPMLAADGRPLGVSLARSLRRQKLGALLLIMPLLLFILVTFVLPIADMLFRSVENRIVSVTLPRTVAALAQDEGEVPGEPVFVALYEDLVVAEEYKRHTQLGTRLNYELGGASSLFRSVGRAVARFGTEVYADQFQDAAPAFEDGAQWAAWMADPEVREALPETSDAYDAWAGFTTEVGGDDPAEEEPGDMVYAALYRDLAAGAAPVGLPAVDVSGFETVLRPGPLPRGGRRVGRA
jgi:putative spermidine/putrescine transport system permease protein